MMNVEEMTWVGRDRWARLQDFVEAAGPAVPPYQS